MLEQLNSISRQHLTHISNADKISRDFCDYQLLAAVKLLQSHRLTTGLFGKVFRDVKKTKLKGSRIRPGVAQKVPGGLGSKISMTFGT
jgi:hypothetical protein